MWPRAWGSDDVPFYDRYYLGGMYSLRGFKYRNISPRQEDPKLNEPIGGNTFWLGSVEYSLPIIERLRFALFYDIGNVASSSYSYSFTDFSDNWGIGLRLNLPIGPLALGLRYPHQPRQLQQQLRQVQLQRRLGTALLRLLIGALSAKIIRLFSDRAEKRRFACGFSCDSPCEARLRLS